MSFVLDEHNAAAYLAARGLLTPDAAARATAVALGGGVSNTVIRVSVPGAPDEPGWSGESEAGGGAGAGGTALVIKQSLSRLRVAEEWYADRERIYRECAAIRYLGKALPGAVVPQARYEDRDNFLFVMTAAPPGGVNWKDALLDGRIDVDAAGQVGALLGAIHRHSGVREDAAIPPELRQFADQRCFVQLRIDPYHRAAAAVHPDLAGVIETEARRMLKRGRALVHGDYSPKNIIVAGQSDHRAGRAPEATAPAGAPLPGGTFGRAPFGLAPEATAPAGAPFLLDFEVAHLGNPVFDLAFMLNHLALKAIHRPELAPQYNAAARAFWTAYRRGSAAGSRAGGANASADTDTVSDAAPDAAHDAAHDSDAEALERDTVRQVGVLLLARVDGKSPVEYITDGERKDFVRGLGRAILLGKMAWLDEVHSRLADAAAA